VVTFPFPYLHSSLDSFHHPS
jgi:hypothetical protein